MSSFLLHLLPTLLPLLLLLPSTAADTLKHDPYIICSPDPPPSDNNGLPPNYSTWDYYNSMQLCSALNGASKNVGCLCTSSDWNSFRCNANVADPLLWAATVTSTGQSFVGYCNGACYCDVREDAARALEADYNHERNPLRYSYNTAATGNSTVRQGQVRGGTQPGHMIGWFPELSNGSSQREGAAGSSEEALKPLPVAQEQCAKNCTGNSDCNASGETGCICATRSEQYQPGSGTVAFLAACIISLAGSPKRGEGRPCPCNSSYVSHSCCGVEDGVVREGPEYKLGELAKGDEL